MKVDVLTSNLRSALKIINVCIDTKMAHVPFTQDVLIAATAGRLWLATTNLERSIEIPMGCKMDMEGAVCVPFKTLKEYADALPDERLTLELAQEPRRLILTCGTIEMTIPCERSAEEYPAFVKPGDGDNRVDTYERTALKSALEKVLPYTATEDNRPILLGVNFEKRIDALVLTACDSFRMCEVKIPQTGAESAQAFVVPGASLKALLKVMPDSPLEMCYDPMRQGVVFRSHDFLFFSSIIDGKFPDVASLIPRRYTPIHMDIKPLRAALKRARLVAKDGADRVYLKLRDNTLELSSVGNNDNGHKKTYSEKLPIGYDREPLETAINVRYLDAALVSLDGERVYAGTATAFAPWLFVGDDPHVTIVVMPMSSR